MSSHHADTLESIALALALAEARAETQSMFAGPLLHMPVTEWPADNRAELHATFAREDAAIAALLEVGKALMSARKEPK